MGEIYWQGWSRMALPIKNFVIIDVQKPKIGENRPNKVRADISVSVKIRNDIKAEWEALRKHDVCFLISLKPTKVWGEKYDYTKPFLEEYSIQYIRGCEIEGYVDKAPILTGDKRTFCVLLDCNQYRNDMNQMKEGAEDVYGRKFRFFFFVFFLNSFEKDFKFKKIIIKSNRL